jgi:hypothetical protein
VIVWTFRSTESTGDLDGVQKAGCVCVFFYLVKQRIYFCVVLSSSVGQSHLGRSFTLESRLFSTVILLKKSSYQFPYWVMS